MRGSMRRLDRRAFLRAAAGGVTAGTALFSGSASVGAEPAVGSVRPSARRPNFVFLLSDDQRWDALGCAGNRVIQTPILDRLARDGVRCSNAFVTTPICAASRASILTGLYERAHGYTFQQPPIGRSLTRSTYPYLLRQAGYRTGFVGKFGMSVEKGAEQEMFDVFLPSALPSFQDVNGRRAYITDLQADQAIDFLRGTKTGQPFCLSVSFSVPHADDDAPEQYFWPASLDTLYRDATIQPPPTSDPAFFEALPEFLKTTMNRTRWHWRFDDPKKYQRMVKGYYRVITAMDAAIGRILDELRRLGLEEDSVVIFASDNGYFLGDRGYADKWTMHEQSIRVPCIVKDGRLTAAHRGRVLRNMVLNVDIPPTIVAMAGVPVPERMQGRSLSPLLAGSGGSWRREIFTEHLWKNPEIPRTEAVRTERWKYIRYPDHPEYEELYDLGADACETRNLAGDVRERQRMAELRRRCDEWIRRIS